MSHVNPYAATSQEAGADPFAQQQGGLVLAGRGQRFLAFFVDMIVQGIVGCPAGFAIGFGLASAMGESQILVQVVSGFINAIVGAIIFLAINGYLLSTQGKTVGKLAVGIRIIDERTNQVPDFWPMVAKRWGWIWVGSAIPIVNIFLGLFAIVNYLMIFRDSHKCFHDDFASTLVVLDSPKA